MNTSPDIIVIGSGFGGSVAALRLAEKGYSVIVLEQGRRFRPEQFAKSNWNLPKAFWMPRLGLHGIQAMTLMKDVFILHGAGVGGGSLVYANNLLVPPDEVFMDPVWGGKGWKKKITPFYERANTMLGATPSKVITRADELLREVAGEEGKGNTFHVNDIGVYFGQEDVTVPDPYFDGRGPDRTGCLKCGSCMTGCRYGAKNTLDLNYLHLAEGLGVKIHPRVRVTDVRPDGDGGYVIEAEKLYGVLKYRREYRAKQVVFAGGVMGSVPLLLKCRANGSLPDLPDSLGDIVRTNSEALVGVLADNTDTDWSEGIAITSGVYPDDDTHIETVRYGKGHDAMSMIATILVGGGGSTPRPLRFLTTVLKNPVKWLKSILPRNWAQRATILLVMQKIDNYLKLELKPKWYKLGRRGITSNWRTEKRVPSYIPVANRYAEKMAEKIGGQPMSVLPEVLFDTSSTAHILGGCVMSRSPETGVVDFQGRVHGYEGLYVMDGSVVPVNLGVNPSLTITAIAEYFMEQFPEKV
jgi:cholesterol oxidase